MDTKKENIFEALFKDNYKGLFIHAFSFVRDEEEARDIVNDAFEYIWEHYRQLDTTLSLKPFLYTIVKTRSIDYLRRVKARKRFSVYYQQNEGEESGEYSDYEESIQKIMALIGQMPAQTALVFRKCFIDRKKYKEAGDELGITVNTVRTHISKALRILRKGFSPEEMTFLLFIFRKN